MSAGFFFVDTSVQKEGLTRKQGRGSSIRRRFQQPAACSDFGEGVGSCIVPTKPLRGYGEDATFLLTSAPL